MSVIQRTAFDSSRIKQKIKQTSYNQNKSKGPLKASYELPTKNWQVKYTYNSPKIVQNGKKFSRALEESSEYGTMENPDPAVPLINLTQTDQDPSFNDVSIGNDKKSGTLRRLLSTLCLQLNEERELAVSWMRSSPYPAWPRPTSPSAPSVSPPWRGSQVREW